MLLLVLGVLLWSIAHLLKAAAPPLRQSIVDRIGADAWRGLFSLVILASLALMILGWRSAPLDLLYLPPVWARHLTMTAMLVSLILFAAAGMPSNLKRRLRHPQLTGVLVWSLGHLAANGELRSVVLFGGIGLWALAEIPLINRRDGAWSKPDPQPRSADVRAVLGGVVAWIALFFAHPFLFGVAPM